MVQALSAESVVAVRSRLVRALSVGGVFSSEVEDRLVQCLLDGRPTLRHDLAVVVAKVAVTASNRDVLLQAYRMLLLEPWLSESVRRAVTDRLMTFSYQEAPGLADCLEALLLRTSDIEEVERYYRLFMRLDSNRKRRAELILTLFYRFAADYPRSPTDEWLGMLHDLAPEHDAIRRQIPYLAQLTGATWILDVADKSIRTSQLVDTVLHEIRRDEIGSAQRLLQQAYQERTLRKKDLLSLFSVLVRYYDSYPLVDELLKIMREVQLFDAAVVSKCLQLQTEFPSSGISYSITGYLNGVAALDLSYRDQVVAAFTHDNYRTYCRTVSGPEDAMFNAHVLDRFRSLAHDLPWLAGGGPLLCAGTVGRHRRNPVPACRCTASEIAPVPVVAPGLSVSQADACSGAGRRTDPGHVGGSAQSCRTGPSSYSTPYGPIWWRPRRMGCSRPTWRTWRLLSQPSSCAAGTSGDRWTTRLYRACCRAPT